MERILDGLKSGLIWTDNVKVEATTLIPMDIHNTIMNGAKTSTVSIMDLGKMLLIYSKEGDTTKVHELMSRGAPFTTDWLGTSPLHLAAMNNHLGTCEVLLRAGISKDARTKVDRTPLHLAVYEGHQAIVELLLKSKCDVNAKDMLKMTPLHWAVERKFPHLVTLLLKFGADPAVPSKFDKTPIALAIETKQNDVFQELISHNQMTMCHQEQQNATDSLMYELEKDNYDAMQSDDNMDADIVYSSPEGSPASTTYQSSINMPASSSAKHNSSKPVDSPALQILKDHGISMLPTDDADNTIIKSALQSGRKLILSDAGKQLILNYPKTTKNGVSNSATDQVSTSPQHTIKLENANKKKPPALVMSSIPSAKSTPLKTNKVIKILSAEEFTKMCGGKVTNNALKKISSDNLSNGNVRLESLQTNQLNTLNKANRRAVMNKCRISTLPSSVKQQFSNDVRFSSFQPVSIRSLSNVQRIPKLSTPVIVSCAGGNQQEHNQAVSESPKRFMVTSTADTASSSSTSTVNVIDLATSSSPTNSTVTLKSSSINKNQPASQQMVTIPKNGLADVMRQLFDLKKQTDDLRKQMEIYQKQNEDYRIRLEKLEKERDVERDQEDSTRQYTNTEF